MSMLIWIEDVFNLHYESSFPEGLNSEIPEEFEVFISAKITREKEVEQENEGWAIVSLRLRIEAEGFTYLTLETAFQFGVSELEPREKKIYKLPKQVRKDLLGTAVSTMRGLLLGYMRGTPLEGFVLPMIDEGDLLTELEKKTFPEV